MDYHLLLYIGALFILSQAGGRIANYFNLPRVTGYLLIGIAVGPYGLRFFTNKLITDNLFLINDIALAVIGFSIGASLQISTIRHVGKRIRNITLYQSILTLIVVTFAMFALMRFTPFSGLVNDYALTEYWVMALFFGAISVATAPAAIIAIIDEYKAKGEFTTILLGVVAIDDALTILFYSLVANVNEVLVNDTAFSWGNLFFNPTWHILLAIAAGVGIGYSLKLLMKFLVSRATILGITLGSILLTAGLALTLRVSPILAVMAFGFTLVNTLEDAKGFENETRHIEEPLFGAFFLLAGAHLRLDLLLPAGITALVMTLSRFGGKYFGAYWGSKISGTDHVTSRNLGLALLPQAGVAIALVFEASILIPNAELSQLLITTILASIVINELITPPVVKYALEKAGNIPH